MHTRLRGLVKQGVMQFVHWASHIAPIVKESNGLKMQACPTMVFMRVQRTKARISSHNMVETLPVSVERLAKKCLRALLAMAQSAKVDHLSARDKSQQTPLDPQPLAQLAALIAEQRIGGVLLLHRFVPQHVRSGERCMRSETW